MLGQRGLQTDWKRLCEGREQVPQVAAQLPCARAATWHGHAECSARRGDHGAVSNIMKIGRSCKYGHARFTRNPARLPTSWCRRELTPHRLKRYLIWTATAPECSARREHKADCKQLQVWSGLMWKRVPRAATETTPNAIGLRQRMKRCYSTAPSVMDEDGNATYVFAFWVPQHPDYLPMVALGVHATENEEVSAVDSSFARQALRAQRSQQACLFETLYVITGQRAQRLNDRPTDVEPHLSPA